MEALICQETVYYLKLVFHLFSMMFPLVNVMGCAERTSQGFLKGAADAPPSLSGIVERTRRKVVLQHGSQGDISCYFDGGASRRPRQRWRERVLKTKVKWSNLLPDLVPDSYLSGTRPDTSLVPIWYQIGTNLIPIWYQTSYQSATNLF
jgi:hypothetical protein